MFERIWRHLSRVTIGSCAALLLVAGTAQADDAAKDKEIQELKAKQEEMAKQLEYLQKFITNQQRINTSTTETHAATRSEVEDIVADVIKAREQAAKADEDQKKKEAAEKGFEIGSDLKMSASWKNGVWVETADQAFRMHFGTWQQWDTWFFKQPNNMRGPAPGGALGIPGSTGVGILDDGDFPRRERLLIEGSMYENIEFKCNTCFENVSTVVFDEVWIGITKLPVIGTIEFGHIKNPQGLESYSSTRFIPMIERSVLLDTFWDEFATGILMTNSFANQRMTYALALAKNETAFIQDGAQFGDGAYTVTGRLTALPLYENDGRCLLHLGASLKYQQGDISRDSNLPGAFPTTGPFFIPGVDTTDLVRFRTRPDWRDTVTVPSNIVGGTLQGFGDNGRFLDTGNIATPNVWIGGTELLWYWNRLNVQSEATLAHMDHAFYPVTPGPNGANVPGNTLRVPFQHVGGLDFWGAYCQVGYFIVNGRRTYDRRFGKYDRVIPEENFFVVRGDDGCCHAGSGAVELLFRYSYVDLNDKIVKGGLLSEQTLGVNWYLNPNMKLQCNYVFAERDVMAPPGFPKPVNGTVQALGFQAAFDF